MIFAPSTSKRALLSPLLLALASLVFVCLATVGTPPAEASGHGDTIRVGGDHNYPPYEFLNENGEPDGYNTELTRAIAEVMGIKVGVSLEASAAPITAPDSQITHGLFVALGVSSTSV